MVYIKWPDNFPKPADQEWSCNKRQTTWKTGPLSLVFGDNEQHIVGQRIFQEWWQKAVEKGYEGEATTSFNIEGRVVITLGKWRWVIEKDEEGWKIDGPSAIQNLNEKALTSSGRLQPSFDFTEKEEAVMGWTTVPTYTISIPSTAGQAKTVGCETTRKFNLRGKLQGVKKTESFDVRFAKDKTEYSLGKLVVFRTEIGLDEVETYSDTQQNVFLWLLRAGWEGTYKMKFDETHGWAEKVETASYQPTMPLMVTTPEFHENDEWLSVAEWSKNRAGWREYGNCKVFSQGFAGGIHDYLWANQIEGAWKTVAASRVPYYFGVKVPGVVGSLRAFAKGFVKTSTTSNEIKKIIKETPLFQVGSLCTAEWVDATKMWDSANNQLVDKKVAVKAQNYEMNQAKMLLNYLNDKGLEGEWQLMTGKDSFWGEQYE